MSKSRIPSSKRKARSSPVVRSTAPARGAKDGSITGEAFRFVGLSLSGGKSDKACASVLEYYPKHGKVFLSQLIEKVKNDPEESADTKLIQIVKKLGPIEMIALDVPLTLPLCLTCTLTCPGAENCHQEHINYMRTLNLQQQKQKKPKKLFTPYTQKSSEIYLSTELEEIFNPQHAMGSNMAPLLARSLFLQKRLDSELIEVFPKLSVWRIGRSLQVVKSHLRFHKHSVSGADSRKAILQALSHHNIAFIYDLDVKSMIQNNHAFESFICALTAFLKYKNQTTLRPKGFPKKEDWVTFPNESIKWDLIV